MARVTQACDLTKKVPSEEVVFPVAMPVSSRSVTAIGFLTFLLTSSAELNM